MFVYAHPEFTCCPLSGMVCEVLGTVVGIAVYTASYAIFVTSEEEDCSSDERVSDPKKVRKYVHAAKYGTCRCVNRN